MSKNASHIPKSQSVNLEKLLRQLYTNKQDPESLVSQLRQETHSSQYQNIIKFVRANSVLRNKIFGNEIPISLQKLYGNYILRAVDFDKEIYWAEACLSEHHVILNEFIKLSKSYQYPLLTGDRNTCENLLNDILELSGWSLWLIKNKLAFEQLFLGLETQKQSATLIKENSQPLVAYLTHYLSMRNENTVSPMRFSQTIERSLEGENVPRDFAKFIEFHLMANINLPAEDLNSILRFSAASGLPDYYESFISVCQIIVNTGLTEHIKAVKNTLTKLHTRFIDTRIDFLLYQLGGIETKPRHGDLEATDAFELYLSGKYLQSYNIATKGLASFPDNFSLIEIAAKSLTASGQVIQTPKTLLEIIIDSLDSTFKKTSNEDEDGKMQSLFKIALNHSSFSWAFGLEHLAMQEFSPTPLILSTTQPNGGVSVTDSLCTLRFSDFNNTPFYDRYVECLEKQYESRLSINYINSLNADISQTISLSSIDIEQLSLLSANRFLKHDCYVEALGAVNDLLLSLNPCIKQQAIKIKAYCLLELNRTQECASFIALVFVNNPRAINVLPLTELVNTLNINIRRRLKGELAIPIVLYLYSRIIDSAKDNARDYAYEDFLQAYSIQRPSDLKTIIEDFDRELVLFFLRDICIESIMDRSIAFSSSSEVAEERLKICRLLIELNDEPIEPLQAEIKDIIRRLMIKKRIIDIEQSKIFVDVEGIKRKVSKTMKEPFNRYLSFLKENIQPTEVTTVGEAIKQALKGDVTAFTKLTFPKNEMNDIFENMVVELRDEFVSNNLYGLDGYLSVRIRHGTLEGQLRSPLEAVHLITQRDSGLDQYRPNNHWMGKFSINSDIDAEFLNNAFAKFSREIDSFINEIKTDWIRVKTKPEEKGFFNFILIKQMVAVYAANVTQNTTFEEFIDYIFSLFFVRLENQLTTIREEFDKIVKSRVNNLLTDLQTDINRWITYSDNSDINNIITHTRTEMQRVINRVISWFRLSKITSKEAVSLLDAISISEESVKTASHSINLEVSLLDVDIWLEGSRLISFVDILYIIFENIIKHSQISTHPTASLTAKYHNNFIEIKVQNKVSKAVISVSANDKMEAIRKAIGEDIYLKSVNMEGGTGLHKILKILSHDFTLNSNFEFGFEPEDYFFVEFRIPASVEFRIPAKEQLNENLNS